MKRKQLFHSFLITYMRIPFLMQKHKGTLLNI